MTRKEYTGVAIFALLWLVVLEVLKARVTGHTLEIIRVFVCLLGIAMWTGGCILGLRKKAWGPALVSAALAGICMYVLWGAFVALVR